MEWNSEWQFSVAVATLRDCVRESQERYQFREVSDRGETEAYMAGIEGLHQVTAIAGDPQTNIDFYTGVLGLPLVKLTLNLALAPFS